MKSSIFWDTMAYSPVKVSQHFRGTYCLHLQGQTKSQARNQHEAGSKHSSACKVKLITILASFGTSELHKFPFTEN
jgi:hypothetical protein